MHTNFEHRMMESQPGVLNCVLRHLQFVKLHKQHFTLGSCTNAVSIIYRIAGYFRGGKFSRISQIGLNSRIFSP